MRLQHTAPNYCWHAARVILRLSAQEINKAQREMIKARQGGKIEHYEGLKDVVHDLESTLESGAVALRGDSTGMATLQKSAEYRTWERKKKRAEMREMADLLGDDS